MAAQKLAQNVAVTDLAPGAQVVLPHGITRALPYLPSTPNVAVPNEVTGISVIAVDDTNITFRNDGLNTDSATFFVALTHSIQGTNATQLWNGVTNYQGASAGNIFIYRPSELNPKGNVYNDWATIVDAMQALDGKKELHFSSPNGDPISLPPSLPDAWPMYGVWWTDADCDLILEDGCVFVGLDQVTNGSDIINKNTTVSPFGDSAVDPSGFVALYTAGPTSFIQDPTALVPCFSGDSFYFMLIEAASPFGENGEESPSDVINTDSGCFCIIGSGGSCNKNTIGGAGFFGYVCTGSPRSGGDWANPNYSTYWTTEQDNFSGFWAQQNTASVRFSIDVFYTEPQVRDADFNATWYNGVYEVDTTNNTVLATLPNPNKRDGEVILFKKIAGANVFNLGVTVGTINGGAAAVPIAAGVMVVAKQGNWITFEMA